MPTGCIARNSATSTEVATRGIIAATKHAPACAAEPCGDIALSSKFSLFAADAEPPYCATIVSWLSEVDAQQREGFIAEVFHLATRTQGFLGAERAHESQDGADFGITVFFWTDLDAFRSWAARVIAFVDAQFAGRDDYGAFRHWVVRVVEVQQSMRMGQPLPAKIGTPVAAQSLEDPDDPPNRG